MIVELHQIWVLSYGFVSGLAWYEVVLLSPALIPVVHAGYVYAMGIKRARDHGRLHWTVKLVAYPTLALILPFYVTLNLILGSITFLEPPRTLQFTARCQRHMRADTWRGAQARWWCRHWLDPYEEGGHC